MFSNVATNMGFPWLLAENEMYIAVAPNHC